MYVCGYMLQHRYASQRTAVWSHFSLSTFMWVPGIKLRSAGAYMAVSLPSAPSHQPRDTYICEFPFTNGPLYNGSNESKIEIGMVDELQSLHNKEK